MVRLQKYLADAGVASRRASEKLIAEGRVSVNGETVREMGVQVDENYDIVEFDGEVVRNTTKKEYIMLNKPVGFITTVSDDKDRPTVMELVSDISTRIYPVGRLDYDTEGLLLLTNDGDLTYRITHPKHDIEKTYVAEVTGDISMDTITQLRRGVEVDGVKTSPAQVEVVGATQYGTKVEITIHEGRNRQVRKMFEAVGCIVKKLRRTREAGLNLGHLPLGKWRKLSESEINMLKKIDIEGSNKKSRKGRAFDGTKKQFKAHSRNSNRKNNTTGRKR
ncbi:MAG: rRNA pseudouridine synthase [Clostridia bacterium]|nr:rRNA pseudouridine synthase [Clostridia bacterium]